MNTSEKPLYTGKKFALGSRFGKLTVVRHLGGRKATCLCDCGNLTVIFLNNLGRNNTSSCGCVWMSLVAYGSTHGHAAGGHASITYSSWSNMKTRCSNQKSDKYKWYGGRGVKVCDRWLVFSNFLKDMGDRPSKSYTLDRVDNNGDYEPSNCKWSTMKEQCANRRKKGSSFAEMSS